MKRKEEIEKGIPKQQKGNQLDTEYRVEANSADQASQLFQKAAGRLLDVNRWDKLSGPLSATFRLTDHEGKEISRPPHSGDYFKINIPAPGPSSGEGYDWVRIEAVEDKRDASADHESITMRVRPAPSPENNDTSTAHFFKDDATSSFVVERRGNMVTAEVHGRNEVPNTTAEKAVDKMRNALVGLGAIAGFSAPQWKSLVKGLVEGEEEGNR
jgi:hypothetical protein